MNLVVMAAGMGSRFGGLKQLTPVGPNGEFLIDYSIYDAKKAGVNKVIFVIKKEMEEEFRKTIGKRIEKYIEVCYAYQELEDTPIKVEQKRNSGGSCRIGKKNYSARKCNYRLGKAFWFGQFCRLFKKSSWNIYPRRLFRQRKKQLAASQRTF